jgi:hypothetical protein
LANLIGKPPLGACIESFQGHVISLSPHGSHLSRNLRTFLARLTVPATSRCMVYLQSVRLSAPTSLASIMVIGPHHAAPCQAKAPARLVGPVLLRSAAGRAGSAAGPAPLRSAC